MGRNAQVLSFSCSRTGFGGAWSEEIRRREAAVHDATWGRCRSATRRNGADWLKLHVQIAVMDIVLGPTGCRQGTLLGKIHFKSFVVGFLRPNKPACVELAPGECISDHLTFNPIRLKPILALTKSFMLKRH